jgi:deazaflavin-dependent oxidoreductase (nitroreductase family)
MEGVRVTGLDLLAKYAGERTIRITTYGRRTGRPHTVTVWFGVSPQGRVFVSSLRTRDWVKNLLANPRAEVEVKGVKVKVRAVPVESQEDKQLVKEIWKRKYGLLSRLMRLPREDGVSFELVGEES